MFKLCWISKTICNSIRILCVFGLLLYCITILMKPFPTTVCDTHTPQQKSPTNSSIIMCIFFSDVLGAYQISWLPCQFTDERVFLNDLGFVETQHIPREAMLQFGQKGDAPVNPYAVTFLITGGLFSRDQLNKCGIILQTTLSCWL